MVTSSSSPVLLPGAKDYGGTGYHCHHLGAACVRTNPRVAPWVLAWFAETVALVALTTGLLVVRRRL
jgi:hypothetical protein